MPEINYRSILETIWLHYGNKLNDWETNFIDNLMSWTGNFSESQKENIIKLNRKYVVKR
jgi:hypothetical protein